MPRLFYAASRPIFTVIGLVVLIATGSCSDKNQTTTDPAPPWMIETPSAPSGFNSARPGLAIVFCVDDGGGGLGTEYQWDFDAAGDTLQTEWRPDSCIARSWAAEGHFLVRARARARGITTEWTEGVVVTIIDEFVSFPQTPTGDDVLPVGSTVRFCTSGAASTLSHPIEHRFSLDPLPATEWGLSKCRSIPWTLPGMFRVRAQARCLFHDGIFSEWSQSFFFDAVSGVDTKILSVVSSPSLSGTAGQSIDFQDNMPDTVSQGHWLTVVVEGSTPSYAFGQCADAINRCTAFQLQYETLDTFTANSEVTSAWFPHEAFDSNRNGLVDTLRIRMGTLNYTINGRAVDEFGPDPTPGSLPIVANFAPTLDDFYVENQEGSAIRNGQVLGWDWWAPANTDTVDSANDLRRKSFFFVIKASAHDDPRDPPGSAVKMWQYYFIASNDPVFFGDFANAGTWAEGQRADAICDTFTWTVTYPLDDIDGDAVFANLPAWINRGWDFTIRGRDSGPLDQFEQVVYLNGETIQTATYSTTASGRRTANGFQQFSMVIER